MLANMTENKGAKSDKDLSFGHAKLKLMAGHPGGDVRERPRDGIESQLVCQER